jgi:hypothetical protein
VYFHPKHSDTILNLIAIERFHPMISSNTLPNFLSKCFFYRFWAKNRSKKNADCDQFATLHNFKQGFNFFSHEDDSVRLFKFEADGLWFSAAIQLQLNHSFIM